ncbi:A/G-specific adenine glycosylase [Epibacterium ulvae]|uniref:A/G-specific adenine glycosylase n=1 Tax=Epibacterium ulvae TaxID=1156985 RepID=UPI00248FD497|nr:A/G-specific adenine glycosylase [Epibacterium ulvae]
MRDQTPFSDARSADLLHWYDRHARTMPWRISPADRKDGVKPDPYRVWMSEVMLQQTTVAAVKAYFLRFTERWPTVSALAGARDEDVMAEWAGLGYYARARNLLKCARVVHQEHSGVFPENHDALLALPGIGPYTAAAISSIAFDLPETVLDGNVERVMARLFDHHAPLPAAKSALKDYAASLTPQERPGDYAQAVMDLGATICTPKSPACVLCPWRDPCQARRNGTAAELPKKTPKTPKPTRHGIAYLARSAAGEWLLERRPEKGLLGGMLGWPGSDWSDTPTPAPPFHAQWRDLGAEVRHTFTHFHLYLRVEVADLPQGYNPQIGQLIIGKNDFKSNNLPTVMRKAYELWVEKETLG